MTKSKTFSSKKGRCAAIKHPDYNYLLPNVNRVAGQVEGIKKMMAERRYCPDILQQLKSIKSAISGIEASILEAHMDSCLIAAFNSKDEREKIKKITELKALYRRV